MYENNKISTNQYLSTDNNTIYMKHLLIIDDKIIL